MESSPSQTKYKKWSQQRGMWSASGERAHGQACRKVESIIGGRTLSSKLTGKGDKEEYLLHREAVAPLWINNLHTECLSCLRKVGSRYLIDENERKRHPSNSYSKGDFLVVKKGRLA